MEIIASSNSSCQSNPAVAGAERPARSLAAAAGNSSSAPLVSYTESCSQISDQPILRKFNLLDLASKILTDPAFLTANEASLIESKKMPRTCLCNKTPLLGGHTPVGVPVYKNVDHESTHFGGLVKCGSPWSCPVCAPKISEGRKNEIQQAFDIWQGLGSSIDKKYQQLMVSFTLPHKYYHKLADLYDQLFEARRLLRQQKVLKKSHFRVFSDLCRHYHIEGQVTAVEATHGYNGWHPHTHDVFFISGVLSASCILSLRSELAHAWLYACKRAGVDIPSDSDFLQHSVQVSIAYTASEYMAKFGHEKTSKWTAACELTKAHLKVSKGQDGMTPFDFLRVISAFPDDRSIYLKYGALFADFVRCTRGRRQLFWSKDFKNALGLTDISDQELAESEDGSKITVGVISAEDWQIVIKNNLRGRVLVTALRRPWEDVLNLIWSVRDGTKKRKIE